MFVSWNQGIRKRKPLLSYLETEGKLLPKWKDNQAENASLHPPKRFNFPPKFLQSLRFFLTKLSLLKLSSLNFGHLSFINLCQRESLSLYDSKKNWTTSKRRQGREELNYFRLVSKLSCLLFGDIWFDELCLWLQCAIHNTCLVWNHFIWSYTSQWTWCTN